MSMYTRNDRILNEISSSQMKWNDFFFGKTFEMDSISIAVKNRYTLRHIGRFYDIVSGCIGFCNDSAR